MSTTSSRNFTTLYSGSGSVVPQGAYGNANVVSLLNVGTDGGNTVSNIVATGNITTTSQISAQGNITTAGFFVGSLVGNVSGNVTAAGSNTQVQFNNNGVLGADADFTYNNGTNALAVTGNITGGNLLTGGSITATGNVTAANFFGNVFGNIVGNVDAAGANTEIQFNTGNLLDASANLTFNKSTSTITVLGNATYATSGLEITANTITGNLNLGNLLITNQFQASSRGAVVIDTSELIVGQDNGALGTNATVRAIRNQALELTTTNAGAPAVYVGKYVANSATYTGNVDTRSSNVGGYAGTGNINLSGNVYVSRDAQGADATFGKANLIVRDSIFADQGITAIGNIQGNVFIGNGSQLTGITGTYGNANVSAYLASGTNTANIITTGNIASGNISTTGQLSVAGNTFLSGPNVTVSTSAIYFLSPGGAGFAGGIGAAAFGPSASYTVATFNTANAFVSTRMQLDDGASNISFDGNTLGNVNIQSQGSNWIFANATGNLTLPSNTSAINYANGTSILNGLPGTYGNANVANFLANGFGSNTISTTGNVTSGNIITAGIVSATGNINGANLVASANLTSTQQTIVGTANITGGTGNIIISGKNIATDLAWNPDGGNATTAAYGRVVVGTGFNGNITHTGTQSRLGVFDSITRAATSTNVRSLDIDTQVSLTGNVTNSSFRQQGLGSRIRVGGGALGNTINIASPGAGSVGTVAALQPNIDVGNVSPYFLGNTAVSHALLNGGFITTYSGGSVGNAYGMVPGAIAATTGNAASVGNITNYTGFASQLGASPFITGNLYAFYHPNVSGSSQQSATGLAVAAAARSATNYYFLRNDDAVAQVQLGSLRSYNEFQYATATSGTVNIDKTNAQVQFIAPTANVTIGDYQNFVTTANDGTNNDTQADTVTLIIQQGATPYTVTMPTGNASIKYASGNSTVGVTANSVTMVSITAYRSVANASVYLTTVSPEFS